MKAAVLGSPIAHSLSPVLHRAAYRALGLTGWTYQAIECDETGLPGLLAGCGPDWAGLSLTMPLKRAVLPLLDRVEPRGRRGRRGEHGGPARQPGARPQHRRARHRRRPRRPGRHRRPAPAPEVLILGAGATACSALAAARDLGIRQVTVAARDPARTTDLQAVAARLGTKVTLTPFGTPAGPASGPPHLHRPRQRRPPSTRSASPSAPSAPARSSTSSTTPGPPPWPPRPTKPELP